MTSHHKMVDNLSIVGRESHNFARIIKEPCISGPMIHPLTGMLGSTSCPTYGMRSCLTPPTPSLIHHSTIPNAHCTWPTPLGCQGAQGAHCFSHPASETWYHTMSFQVSLITQTMVPSVLSINIVKYNVFHRHNEAMLLVMVKAHLLLKKYSVIQNLEGLYSSYKYDI